MPDVNKANRQVCDVLINDLKTMKPFLSFDTANTTTAGLSSDSVYAMAKGSRRISFTNPLEGEMKLTAQVYPFKLYALFSDGVIDNTAVYADHQTVTCATAGELALTVPQNGTITAGTVFAYPADSFGDEAALIVGTYADNKFTATNAGDIAVGAKYTVGYVINRTGVKKIAFNNSRLPKDYYITMSTVDKDENGLLTPFKIIAYKATINRNFELSFSSEGDPSEVELSFSLMEDKDGNVLDMVELTDEAI